MSNVIILGSSGYLGSKLYHILTTSGMRVVGFDLEDSDTADIVTDVFECNFSDYRTHADIIINCVAIRVDHGFSADEYFDVNVRGTRKLFSALNLGSEDRVFHISSVAALDGCDLTFSSDQKPDDAYKSTKHRQDLEVVKFCQDAGASLSILYPSAIYDETASGGTNIARLQKIGRLIPFVPEIKVRKSLTERSRLCCFIASLIRSEKHGSFVTFERPVRDVTEILKSISGNQLVIRIPGLYYILLLISYVCSMLSFTFGRDLGLLPSRVRKLYRDSSYSWVNFEKEKISEVYFESSWK